MEMWRRWMRSVEVLNLVPPSKRGGGKKKLRKVLVLEHLYLKLLNVATLTAQYLREETQRNK